MQISCERGCLRPHKLAFHDGGASCRQLHRATTRATRQVLTEPAGPTRRGSHPRPYLPRRIVADVLPMPTLELCHPLALGILMEANNTPFHAGRSQGCLTGGDSPIPTLRPCIDSSPTFHPTCRHDRHTGSLADCVGWGPRATRLPQRAARAETILSIESWEYPRLVEPAALRLLVISV
jgi:hypothetical protein